MLDELGTVGLADAARALGCEPFDVVQLAVASRGSLGSAPLVFAREELDKFRQLGKLEATWWTNVQVPSDANKLRGRVRAILQQLQVRGYLGEIQTRLDNVWRGLAAEEREALRDCVAALVEDGLLVTTGSPVGIMVSIDPRSMAVVQDLVGGKSTPDALKAALGD